jgi:hypothetical protein
MRAIGRLGRGLLGPAPMGAPGMGAAQALAATEAHAARPACSAKSSDFDRVPAGHRAGA